VNPTCSNAWSPSGCSSNGFYKPGSSSTSKSLGTGFSIVYGIGSASGIYYTDSIAMGGRILAHAHLIIEFLRELQAQK
jgi:Eukaryotic aspartyl protease